MFHTEQEPSAGEREGRAPRKKELGKGYADMVLVPVTARYPSLRHGYVVELKYLKRERESEPLVRSTLEAAKDQLRGYLADERLAQQHLSVRFTGVVLVFRGWELVGAEAVDGLSLSRDDPLAFPDIKMRS